MVGTSPRLPLLIRLDSTRLGVSRPAVDVEVSLFGEGLPASGRVTRVESDEASVARSAVRPHVNIQHVLSVEDHVAH